MPRDGPRQHFRDPNSPPPQIHCLPCIRRHPSLLNHSKAGPGPRARTLCGRPPYPLAAQVTRSDLRRTIRDFLRQPFSTGAFQGTTGPEAYFAKHDATTTTRNDIDRGRVRVEIGIAALCPAEFVVLRVEQKPPLPLPNDPARFDTRAASARACRPPIGSRSYFQLRCRARRRELGRILRGERAQHRPEPGRPPPLASSRARGSSPPSRSSAVSRTTTR
jgi:hypothetical protein